MGTTLQSPGPNADHAFRFGMVASGAVGVTAIGVLIWTGILSLAIAGYVFLALYPVYLVFSAIALSVWLGYNRDATALRPVYRRKDTDTDET